ncbi:hypothetical protein [Pedobacter sp. BMA]|uniref:hypothetical protein n=1 Tax=Pedobacter sp. BMA TaxID=1663685 RepID=UPI00064A18EC|nr:hypothetical protein [Pedobacter sp. BMA]KLT63965.1 hypothetical protein AB669_19790 [Pedobacter sp. BMA]
MSSPENSKSEKDILNDIQQVHQKIESNPEEQYDPSDTDAVAGDLQEQVKGSDADSDRESGEGAQEDQKQEQEKGSDADHE